MDTKDVESPSMISSSPISRYLIWLVWVIWLPFIIPPIVDTLQADRTTPFRLIIILVVAALFIALYLWATWQIAGCIMAGIAPREEGERAIWLKIVGMVVLGFVLALSGPADKWLSPFIFTSSYIGGSLRTKPAIWSAIALAISIILLSRFVTISWLELLQATVFILAVCFIVMIVIRAIKMSRELRIAREEIARLAVVNERLRIARDLHDVLGHSLSLIALKSELARRLVDKVPARAISEIADIEQVARATLQEVREAVANYRQPTLENELHGASELLLAAGIDYQPPLDAELHILFPTTIESVLAWAVREGVTNIIRHSRAHHCTIALHRANDTVTLTISNDGVVPRSEMQSTRGNGLRGLAERVEALSGTCESGLLANGLFRLTITLPYSHKLRPASALAISSAERSPSE
ncbi:two-component sensor histidine kinase [Dictyobacter alpinus]|uniref:Two-component sensor histidine kinase n=1 Tax=Dictyobacter alpinus TaxID=2014873 RepID=A0A402BAB7_9CHLR|nr:sensor histidine kinase [Dictyobacter alpinus]GCE28259.1 two-component sensor histidine kinase [Dictyobacter alpinus]